ncbi:hypothetical protein PMG71_07600 [Roseofilum sp. BLCC_M154]|uniref:Uncharacterized protein n=1 Tax=Roseofilum acuticapitatum BLCC-M154 TaxID=3022444 RepID=A0ABT7AQW5_9CYAN|nr:hypothetical protein [Roseofilum acuticapitatum]MDJ1169286.1 hypothetical protein [Roseofilum acuticapitatum BLCC-M154]
MTTERWDDERLDRLGDRIERLIDMAERHDRLIEVLANASTEAKADLDRHDRLIESNARVIEALANASTQTRTDVDRHDRLIESNARIIQALANAAAEAGEERQQLFQRMDQRQEEIRGLQTENRRILDILLNQQNQEVDSTDE